MVETSAVVGGGIVGLSTAFYLSKDTSKQVILFDVDKGQATRATGGIIAPWLSRRRNKVWYQMVKEAAAFYPQFITDLGEDLNQSQIYRKSGALIFKKEAYMLREVMELAKERRKGAPEMGDLAILNPKEIQKLWPLYDKDHEAFYVEGGAKADGRLMVDKLRQLLEENDRVTLVPEEVTHIDFKEGNHSLHTSEGSYTASEVVLATGAWLNDLLQPAGYEVDTLPQKGQLAVVYLDGVESEDWPVIMPAGGNNIIPFEAGRILVGATHEKEDGFSIELIPERVTPLIEDAANQVSEAFRQADRIEYRVGVRGYTSDYSPFFGPLHDLRTVYAINGLGATGLTAGPLVGKVISQMILDQEPNLVVENYSTVDYIKRSSK